MVKLDPEEFSRLMTRVRAGDETAASELVKHYEPEIQREIRFRLTNRKLRRVVDSIDISQSVFGIFFIRAVHGEFDLQRPEQLLRLLCKMATNKVIDRHRHETVRRSHETVDDPVEHRHVPAKASTASEIVSGQELIRQFKSRLTDEEERIADLRRKGVSWDQIANALGQNAEALRKRLARASNRVLGELGL